MSKKKKPKKGKCEALDFYVEAPEETSKISHISELQAMHEDLAALMPQVPYHRNFSIDSATGNFEIYEGTTLAPEEALRLARFLVDFYGEK